MIALYLVNIPTLQLKGLGSTIRNQQNKSTTCGLTLASS
jgi:hypothetical protein